MSKNVSISSLLSNDQVIVIPDSPEPSVPSPTIVPQSAVQPVRSNIQSLVSQFQTNIKVDNQTSLIEIDNTPIPQLQPSPLQNFRTTDIRPSLLSKAPIDVLTRAKSVTPTADLTKNVTKFQTDFQFEVHKKTSIMSIMNYDKPLVEEVKEQPDANTSHKKKPIKKEGKKADAKKPEKRKLDKKTQPNKRKKTPEPLTDQEKSKEVINLPPPEIIDVSNKAKEAKPEQKPEHPNNKEDEKTPKDKSEKVPEKVPEKTLNTILEPTEKKEQKELPIIALNIPLLDPKNPKSGESEVVVNVMKLAEDKYGWGTIHPNAKLALDVMDDLIDDDEDNDDDEKEEEEELDKRKKEENLTEEQLIRQHETKMNRKVGKYDYEDPFIDDDELQWEEKLSSTKEGFFVYWGPLIEERNVKKIAKKR